MLHNRCSNSVDLHKFTSFYYYYCSSCKEEVRGGDVLLNETDLRQAGWDRIAHPNADYFWQFENNRPEIWINFDDAKIIQGKMMEGKKYDDAYQQWVDSWLGKSPATASP